MVKYYAVVEFEAPKDAPHADIVDFFTELQCVGGCREPEDPLFESFDNVRVIVLRRMNQ